MHSSRLHTIIPFIQNTEEFSLQQKYLPRIHILSYSGFWQINKYILRTTKWKRMEMPEIQYPDLQLLWALEYFNVNCTSTQYFTCISSSMHRMYIHLINTVKHLYFPWNLIKYSSVLTDVNPPAVMDIGKIPLFLRICCKYERAWVLLTM